MCLWAFHGLRVDDGGGGGDGDDAVDYYYYCDDDVHLRTNSFFSVLPVLSMCVNEITTLIL